MDETDIERVANAGEEISEWTVNQITDEGFVIFEFDSDKPTEETHYLQEAGFGPSDSSSSDFCFYLATETDTEDDVCNVNFRVEGSFHEAFSSMTKYMAHYSPSEDDEPSEEKGVIHRVKSKLI